MKRLAIVALLFVVGCSGKAPTAPTMPVAPIPPVPAPQTFTLTGTIISSNGGSIGNVSVLVGGVAAAVSGNTFSVTLPAPQIASVIVTGESIITRATVAAVPGTTIVQLFGTGFDLKFYRELVRDYADGNLLPIQRWTQAPRIYLQTVDDRNAPVDVRVLNDVAAAMENVAGALAGDRFGLAGIERGTASRETEPGWITVKWVSSTEGTTCGNTNMVGQERGGIIRIWYRHGGCRCTTTIAQHELGHAMGYTHTSGTNELMSNPLTCGSTPSQREREYMRYAYSRPVGNLDPDRDP